MTTEGFPPEKETHPAGLTVARQYYYGAVGHWIAGLGELQGDGVREISASF